MAAEDQGSISHWIADLKAGTADAAQPLWERYFERLVRLARKKIQSLQRAGGDEDEEDATLSTFNSFCAGAARRQFPKLADRHELWHLLVVITARKANAQAQRRWAQKRGGDWSPIGMDAPDETALHCIIGPEPIPKFAVLVVEEYRALLDRLGDDELPEVALWRIAGYSADEVA
jgi:hypothetical protein